MDTLKLLVELHKSGIRQGPGGNSETLKAIELAGLNPKDAYTIADIGCGTGASALLLAQNLNAHVTAIDFIPDFIDALKQKAHALGLIEKINPCVGTMDSLPFEPNTLDIIWSEGAIYNVGFEAGIKSWYPFLKTGGLLVVSEITWLTQQRPAALQHYWQTEYPEIDSASGKIAQLEQNGYQLAGYFFLPKTAWLANYYNPLETRFQSFLAKYPNNKFAKSLIEAEKKEIELYKQYSNYYSYGFYIARKI